MSKKIVIAYIPVLHDGYRKFIESINNIDKLYIIDKDLIIEEEYLSKEIRALEPQLIKKSLDSWGLNFSIQILNKKELVRIKLKDVLIMPDDDISHSLKEKYFKNNEVIFENIFLRWDKRNSIRLNKIAEDQVVTSEKFSKMMINVAEAESNKSSDWWRHVGALIIKDGKIILSSHNRHVPSQHTPYVNGDPRNAFHKGDNLELSTSIHAEAGLIAQAAQKGLSLDGSEIYVTTFPCPPCAKLIAYSGIKKIYYKDGYGILDGEGIMKYKGVKIIQVK